jgi:hypothetical protein
MNLAIFQSSTNFSLKITNFFRELLIYPQYFQDFLGNFLIIPNFSPKILLSLRAGEATKSFFFHFFLDEIFSYFFSNSPMIFLHQNFLWRAFPLLNEPSRYSFPAI